MRAVAARAQASLMAEHQMSRGKLFEKRRPRRWGTGWGRQVHRMLGRNITPGRASPSRHGDIGSNS